VNERLNIVLPAREPTASKNRLSPLLSDAARCALAIALFRQALGVFRKFWPGVRLTVVTDSAEFSAEAAAAGAVILQDKRDGLTEAVLQATAQSVADGFAAQLVVHADIATLQQDELAMLIDTAYPAPSVVIVPSADEGGTNALLTTPPDVITHWYGPGSFARHVAQAEAKGIPVTVLRLPGLALDLDTADDVRAFLATSPSGVIADELERWDCVKT